MDPFSPVVPGMSISTKLHILNQAWDDRFESFYIIEAQIASYHFAVTLHPDLYTVLPLTEFSLITNSPPTRYEATIPTDLPTLKDNTGDHTSVELHHHHLLSASGRS